MIERERIEFVIKSNVGTLVSADLEGDIWRCHVTIPKNIDARLSGLKKTFPGMRLVKRDGENVYVTIPVHKHGRRTNGRVVGERPSAIMPANAPRTIVTPEAREHLLLRLAELYEMFFEEPGDVLRIDDTHFKLTFAGDMTYPYHHPFMSLLPYLMPDLTPVAVSTEHYGTQKRTTIYLSTHDERPKGPGHGIAVFIDGSHRDGTVAYGVCYYKGGHPSGFLVGALSGMDSNGAELMALLQALSHLDDTAQDVTIYTDSSYVYEWSQNEGRLWMEKAINRHISVKVQLIKRDHNENAHALAYKFLNRLFA